MLDFDIGSQDILVLSNYRSGSTAFDTMISRKYGLKDLGEAFNTRLKDPRWYEQNKAARNLVKVMPDQTDHPEFESVMSKSFVIGLSRRDVIAQISSLYICRISGIWHQYSSVRDDYQIQIDRDFIRTVIKNVLDLRARYEKMKQIGRAHV